MLTSWPSASWLTPAALTVEIWMKTSFPPSSLATKPKPLPSSNHLTLPLRGTAVEGSGRRGPRPGRAGGNPRNGRSTIPEASMSTTLATCGPLGPSPTIICSFAPAGTDFAPRPFQDVYVQECVALAAGQFDEAVALVLVEPFDDARDHLATLRRGPCLQWGRPEAHTGVGLSPCEPWPRPMGNRLIVIEAMSARRPEIAIRVHKAQTFRSVEFKDGRSLITDAALSRRTSAKPRDGAHVAPKIRDSKAPPTWILWSERGVRGGGGGMSAGGTRSRSRLAGGSGAPWLDRAKPRRRPGEEDKRDRERKQQGLAGGGPRARCATA